jgi:hypothetical protein
MQPVLNTSSPQGFPYALLTVSPEWGKYKAIIEKHLIF